MRIVPVYQLKYGMRIAQNIYRHDSLLALPKGATIKHLESEIINYYNYEYVLVYDDKFRPKMDLTEVLEIIHTSYKHNTIWSQSFGNELYLEMEKVILRNKTIQEYLMTLREIDSYSLAHCINISILTTKVLNKNEILDKNDVRIALLSLLHDIGRIKMNNIFNKEGTLTEQEFKTLQTHPIESFKLLKRAGFADYEIKFVGETHERYDGTGYPYKLQGEIISPLAQIIFIADVYNGLSSYRPHRKPYTPFEVVEMIIMESDKMFGEEYIEVFARNFTPYRVGTWVELDNGATAVVKRISESRMLLPVVDVISEQTGEVQSTIDLGRRRDIRIQKIIQTY